MNSQRTAGSDPGDIRRTSLGDMPQVERQGVFPLTKFDVGLDFFECCLIDHGTRVGLGCSDSPRLSQPNVESIRDGPINGKKIAQQLSARFCSAEIHK
jgi:hypothetical protein